MNLKRDYGQRFLIFSLRSGEVIRDIYFYNTDYISIWISCHFLFLLKKCIAIIVAKHIFPFLSF